MYLSSGLSFRQMRRSSCTMDGLCLFYLLMILLMRSGDVETNPGPDSIVTEKEFFKLSTLIAPSYYRKLGVHLEIRIAELDQIFVQCMGNTSDALMTVFTRWRNKQPPGTDIRALLAEGLERSDLGSLSGQLLPGSLVPNRTVPESQTQPLSPDLIKRCADDFKFKYRTTLCKIRADPLNPTSIVPWEDMYTNPVLEEEYRERKRPLEYKDLFKLKVNGEFPKRIVIQGEAGAGKTTFCAKIAWDWINNSPNVPNFVWVLVVPLREAKQYTIGEIVKSYLSKDNPATACQITEYIRSNPKDVFIAFDGLDEFDGKVVQQRKAGSKSECHQPKSADQTKGRGSSSERGDIALIDILCSDELVTCPVLVTSRPWKVTEIRWDDSLMKLYTFIHVEGFSKENVEVYIRKYFEDDEATADQLIQLTKDNDIISENMAPYPFYITMLCHMWRELGDKKREKFKSFQTFSQIFDEMFEFLKVHYVQKKMTDLGSPSFQEYHSQIEKLMEPVAKVAFIGLQENTLIFKEGVFEQCSDSMETACRVGVLSQEKKLSSKYEKSSPPLQSTIFFPHKLFQEYMAGVHLASLYELDHNEFNRLIEQVVLPRKEEFRHLLYFTVSQNKTIANHVMKCMVQGFNQSEEDKEFLVDVSFESQDLDTAALVRGVVSSPSITHKTKVHTIAGFVFTGIHLDMISLDVRYREFGPTISHDLVEIICSAPSLVDVTLLQASFHSDFYAVLAKEGYKSEVKGVVLQHVTCPTSASSHNLVEALCSMPNLTLLTLCGDDFQEEFYSTLNAKASILPVKGVVLQHVTCPTSASSLNLADALCSMPNLTELQLVGKDFQEEFYSTLNAKVSTLPVQSLTVENVECPTSTSSHHLVDALCSMPNLTKLQLVGKDFQEEFYATLNAKASTLQVETVVLKDVRCPTLASSHQLLDALCSMPNLTELQLLGKNFQEEFYSTLNAKASTLQVKTLKLKDVRCPTSASSHHEVEALSSMPNLTKLKIGGEVFQEEFYSTRNAKASTLQVPSLKLHDVRYPTQASSHHLAEALCSMPNLTDLFLEMDLNDEFYSTLKAKASSIQGSFPQIRKGNFRFNEVALDDLNSFLHIPTWFLSLHDSDNSADSGSSNDSVIDILPRRTLPPSDHSQQQLVGDVHYPRRTELPEKQSNQESRWLHPDTTDDGNQIHWDFLTDCPQELTLQDDEAVISCGIRFSPSGAKLSEPIKVTLDHNAHFSNPSGAEIVFYTRNKDSKSFVRIPASTGGYPRCDVRAKDLDLYVDHFSDWLIVGKINANFDGKKVNCTPYVQPPVRKEFTKLVLLCIYEDLPHVTQKIKEEMTPYTKLFPSQPMFVEWKLGDINIKLFDGPKRKEKEIEEQRLCIKDIKLLDRQQFSFEVKPLESGARQKFLKFTLNQQESLSDPTSIRFELLYDDMGATRATAQAQAAGVSTLSQIDLESEVHHPSTSSDKHHVDNTSDTQPSQTNRESSGSRSWSHKRKNSCCTLSIVPQDVPEIPEKQSKTDLESDGILNTLSKHMPPRTYATLCTHLGIGYDQANSILSRFNMDYQRATRDCLAQWKTRTGGNMAQLKEILKVAEAGDLVKYLA